MAAAAQIAVFVDENRANDGGWAGAVGTAVGFKVACSGEQALTGREDGSLRVGA